MLECMQFLLNELNLTYLYDLMKWLYVEQFLMLFLMPRSQSYRIKLLINWYMTKYANYNTLRYIMFKHIEYYFDIKICSFAKRKFNRKMSFELKNSYYLENKF